MTATKRCPNGHESEWEDYCSACGAAMAATSGAGGGGAGGDGGGGSASMAGAPLAAPAVSGASGPLLECAACSTANDSDAVFCENCGHDLSKPAGVPGSPPASPEATAAPPAPSPGTPSVSAGSVVGLAALKARVRADRTYFDKHASDSGLSFPDPLPTPFEVGLDHEVTSIGRRSASRGIKPTVDLGGAFDDPAVSHRHAEIHRQGDSLTIVDVGSTNGTRVDAEDALLTPGEATVLKPGSRIFLGAWTRIDII